MGVDDAFRYEIDTLCRKPNWNVVRDKLTGRAWIGRFEKCPEPYAFDKRNIFFLVESDGKRLSAGTLVVWRGKFDGPRVWASLEQYVEAADTYSNSAYETALAVAEIWGGDDEQEWWTDEPFCTGNLCIFDRFLINARTSAEIEAIWKIVDALLRRLRHGAAAMILKAFPLVYEGRVTDENRPAFLRRQQALCRLYRRRLDVEPVPHEPLAKSGWMFRLFKDGARPDRSSSLEPREGDFGPS